MKAYTDWCGNCQAESVECIDCMRETFLQIGIDIDGIKVKRPEGYRTA